MRELDALPGAGEDHHMIADHVAAAQRGETDRAGLAGAGQAVPTPIRHRGRSTPRPRAAATPSASAVPEGASTLCW